MIFSEGVCMESIWGKQKPSKHNCVKHEKHPFYLKQLFFGPNLWSGLLKSLIVAKIKVKMQMFQSNTTLAVGALAAHANNYNKTWNFRCDFLMFITNMNCQSTMKHQWPFN